MDQGSLRQTVAGLTILMMLNGPMNLVARFLESLQRRRSQVDNHTLCPPIQWVRWSVRLLEGSPGPDPGVPTLIDESLYGCAGNPPLSLAWEQGWLVPVGALELGDISR